MIRERRERGERRESYDVPPMLDAPPLHNLFCIYGINLATEVSFYMKKGKSTKIGLDTAADSMSKKVTQSNPSGLTIKGGIGFETKTTPQRVGGLCASGDGTVPYASLTYPKIWTQMAKERGSPLNVEFTEIQGAEHRKMLADESVIINVLSYCCYGKRLADLDE